MFEFDTYIAEKMKFSTKDFLVNVTEAAVSTDLITFNEKSLNGRLHFCAVLVWRQRKIKCENKTFSEEKLERTAYCMNLLGT